MKCPFCGYADSKVVDSRPADEGSSIRRRRECLKCGKRFTTYETIERTQLVNKIEQRLFSSLDYEISSKLIGEMVMEELRSVDEVAYVRFASVYRQFKDINTFMEELNMLIKDK